MGVGLNGIIFDENDTIRSDTYDLLVFHSNHRPISHRFRDRKFSHSRVLSAPAEEVPLGIGYRRMGQKKIRMMGLLEV